ncbi:hypothetical protein GGX14DRAFT_351997 [Mycena pura]|uniref:AB hydrolase-1 domain-containing protein n=1 Tax=Mycena pura TaxID=153505 RepID=A0AAD6YM53_9AGAR|nr:hypothetical protein GGX14DRAFT_351997 [Mycena pura]
MGYTEHFVKLSDGVQILYTDTGAPQASSASLDYTTLVVLHGSGFNGDGLVPLHKHAHNDNLRIILWNRRDYRGSTKYTSEELNALVHGSKTHQDRLALHLAWFFAHFIKFEGTPALTPDRKAGGFILVGWSFGCATALALLADPAVIPRPLYETIEPYLMGLVLYDPPGLALGNPLPDGCVPGPPFVKNAHTPAQLCYQFQVVSAYFTHPDIATGTASGLSTQTRPSKMTINSWTPEQLERYFDGEALLRSEFPWCVGSYWAVIQSY